MPDLDEKAAERRLIKLAAWFLARGEPATREDVYAAFPDDYTGSAAAMEKKWSRDKRDLQRLGVPLRFVEDLDEKGAYTIDPGGYYLPRLDFTASESAVLQTAARAALGEADHPLHEDVEGALRKLLLGAEGLPPRAATFETAREPVAPPQLRRWLSTIADAIEDRRRLHLEYWVPGRDEVTERDVSPYGYAWRRGEWILVGWCHVRQSVRVFYLRRVRALGAARLKEQPPHYELPAGFDVRVWSRQEAWDYFEHEPMEATVRFRGSLAKIAAKLLPGAKLATAADNARVARLVVRSLDGLVRQCLAWGPEAELVAPDAGRARARECLAELTSGAAAAAAEGAANAPAGSHATARGAAPAAARSATVDSFVKRTRRLLLLIPAVWKATAQGREGISLAQAVRITGARDEAMVRADVESLHGLSLAPSMPDDQLLLEIEGGLVRVDRTLSLCEPPRFSLREGAALLAALKPFADDSGPAVKAVARKLRRAIPEFLRAHADQLASATDFQVAAPGEWASSIEEAIARRLEVIVEYRASATGEASRKTLEPRLLFPQDGHWYLAAWNVDKREEHLYRLDRIVSVELGARIFGAHQGPPVERYRRKQLYFAAGTEREVEVHFRATAAKIAQERWPQSARAEADGSVIVTARLTPGAYLFGWVLGFGGDATIVDPPDVRVAFAAHVSALQNVYDPPPAAAAAGR